MYGSFRILHCFVCIFQTEHHPSPFTLILWKEEHIFFKIPPFKTNFTITTCVWVNDDSFSFLGDLLLLWEKHTEVKQCTYNNFWLKLQNSSWDLWFSNFYANFVWLAHINNPASAHFFLEKSYLSCHSHQTVGREGLVNSLYVLCLVRRKAEVP